jgi:uncharacterized membrane protein YbhN (UPF0104 family)
LRLAQSKTRHGFFIRWILPALGAAVAIAILFWLYQSLDFGRFLSAITNSNSGWLGVLAGTILLEQLTRAWKWRQILFDVKPVSSFRLFGAILAGYGAAILIPLGISPLVRSWLVARLEGLRWAGVLMTSAIGRFLDGIIFALFAGLVALAGNFPEIDGDVRTGMAVGGGLNLVLFSVLLSVLFIGRAPLNRDEAIVSRVIDWLAARGGGRLDGLRSAIRQGIVWPRSRLRQAGAVLASILMKLIAATNFLWAGLAVGVVLAPFDYLFLMVFAGFALVLARFIRVPGGFVIGSGFALSVLGVPNEEALAMILFTHIMTIILMVGPGMLFLWHSGIRIRDARRFGEEPDGAP